MAKLKLTFTDIPNLLILTDDCKLYKILWKSSKVGGKPCL